MYKFCKSHFNLLWVHKPSQTSLQLANSSLNRRPGSAAPNSLHPAHFDPNDAPDWWTHQSPPPLRSSLVNPLALSLRHWPAVCGSPPPFPACCLASSGSLESGRTAKTEEETQKEPKGVKGPN